MGLFAVRESQGGNVSIHQAPRGAGGGFYYQQPGFLGSELLLAGLGEPQGKFSVVGFLRAPKCRYSS